MSEIKQFKEAMKQFSERLSEYIGKAEEIEIFSHADTISFHASVLLASIISERKGKVKISIFPRPPDSLKEKDAIFVGFNGKDLRSKIGNRSPIIESTLSLGSKDSVQVAQLNPVLQATAALGNISLLSDGRLFVAYSSLFQEMNVVGEEDPILSIVQAEAPIKVNKKAFSLIQTSSRSLLDSLFHTIDPFFPGFSGKDSSSIESRLRSLGIDPSVPFSRLGEEEIKRLVEALVSELSYRDGKQAKRDLIRPYLSFQQGEREYDLKEVGEALDVSLELGPGSLFSYYSGESPVEAMLAMRVNNLAWASEALRKILAEKREIEGGEGIFEIACDSPRPLHYAGNVARKMGLINNGILACSLDGKRITSIFELPILGERLEEFSSKMKASPHFPFVYI
ncbi:MAG: hypothetical protein JHC28_04795 [Thermoprotei archaeon]|nr:hypothetical protein [Thermoprotei archaeon]